MTDLDAITDGKIEVVGPDFSAIPAQGSLDMGIVIEVAGRKMQQDFEPCWERQVALLHQRRIGHSVTSGSATSRGAHQQRHADKASIWSTSARFLHARFHADFGAIVDKVQVTTYTDPAKHAEWLHKAREAYDFRNRRLPT